MKDEKRPVVAVPAFGIFAPRSFNLQASMGTRGHLAVRALAVNILGSPFAAIFILTRVLIARAAPLGGMAGTGISLSNENR